MVERRIELNRRYNRKKKLRKLKAKYASATNPQEQEKLLYKIHCLSPWWTAPKAAQ